MKGNYVATSLDGVQAWVAQRFSDTPREGRIAKLLGELDELAATNYTDIEEMADVVIVLCHLAAAEGVSLWGAIQAKHALNLRRAWAQNPDGSYSHR